VTKLLSANYSSKVRSFFMIETHMKAIPFALSYFLLNKQPQKQHLNHISKNVTCQEMKINWRPLVFAIRQVFDLNYY